MNARETFLIAMYEQASAHLNRHILTTWQSVGVAATALSVLVFGDKIVEDSVRFDFVIAIVIALCAWMIAQVFDADNWFNRNLHIVANIERQFLIPSDDKEIHFYFKSHRLDRVTKRNRISQMILHFRIHFFLGVLVAASVLAYHFYRRVAPGLSLSFDHIEPIRGVPYLVAMICATYSVRVSSKTARDYLELRQSSPGKVVDQKS